MALAPLRVALASWSSASHTSASVVAPVPLAVQSLALRVMLGPSQSFVMRPAASCTAAPIKAPLSLPERISES